MTPHSNRAARAGAAQDTQRLGIGTHVAPFLSTNGLPVLLSLGPGECMQMMAELTEVRGARRIGDDRIGATLRAVPAHFLPPEGELLSRGVYAAPWRTHDGIRDTSPHVPAMIAVDARHRLVAEMPVTRETSESAVRRDLTAVLEAWEEAEAERDATRTRDEAVTLTLAENPKPCIWKKSEFARGVYRQPAFGGRIRYYAIDSTGMIAAEVETHQHDGPIVRALWYLLDQLEPEEITPSSGGSRPWNDVEDDDDFDSGEEWKRGARQ